MKKVLGFVTFLMCNFVLVSEKTFPATLLENVTIFFEAVNLTKIYELRKFRQ